MPVFVAPMISLYSRDLARAAFYSEFGFLEISRTRRRAILSISNSPHRW